MAHGAEALRLAYLMTGDRALAEDVAQEAFVRLLKRFNDLRNPDAFRAFLLRTVVALIKSHFMKRTEDGVSQVPRTSHRLVRRARLHRAGTTRRSGR